MRKRKLFALLIVTILITTGAVVYLGVWFYQAGGPYSIDPEGCGVKYVSHPEGGDEPVRVCREDSLFVPIAKILAISGTLASIVFIVLLLLPKEYVKEKI